MVHENASERTHRIASDITHRDGRRYHVVVCSCGLELARTDSSRVAQQSARDHLSEMAQRELFDKAMAPPTNKVEQEIRDHGVTWHVGCCTFLPDSYREMRAKYSADVVQHDYDLCHVWR